MTNDRSPGLEQILEESKPRGFLAKVWLGIRYIWTALTTLVLIGMVLYAGWQGIRGVMWVLKRAWEGVG